MTPPTTRKAPAAARPAVARPTARPAVDPDVRRFVGADRLVQSPGQRVKPAGVTHVVDGWQPVCGGPRIRFVFPGCPLDDVTEICDACASSSAIRRVPRQRRESTG